MNFEYQTGGDISTGSKFLQDPGTYHVLITQIEERPTSRSGNPIDNAAFRVCCSVLAGTVEGQKDKITDILFFNPRPADKNEGAFAKKKLDVFFLATGLATVAELSEKGRVLSIELSKAQGRQMVAKFEKEEGRKFLSLSFADIFHVDDPAVKDIPKDAGALSALPASQRLIGEQPKAKKEPSAVKLDYDYSSL